MTYEYDYQHLPEGIPSAHEIVKISNEQGQKGWKLVCCIDTIGQTHTLIFKRELI